MLPLCNPVIPPLAVSCFQYWIVADIDAYKTFVLRFYLVLEQSTGVSLFCGMINYHDNLQVHVASLKFA